MPCSGPWFQVPEGKWQCWGLNLIQHVSTQGLRPWKGHLEKTGLSRVDGRPPE